MEVSYFEIKTESPEEQRQYFSRIMIWSKQQQVIISQQGLLLWELHTRQPGLNSPFGHLKKRKLQNSAPFNTILDQEMCLGLAAAAFYMAKLVDRVVWHDVTKIIGSVFKSLRLCPNLCDHLLHEYLKMLEKHSWGFPIDRSQCK